MIRFLPVPLCSFCTDFTYLIMERLEAPLKSIIPALLQQKTSSKNISLGPIAKNMVGCIRAIHEKKLVVQDVKTDNFMLATGCGKGRTFEEKLASKVRIIDLALSDQINSSKESSGMVGTPLFASLNVHGGNKVRRKDDLEAAGYVLADLLVKLASGDESKNLPWSNGTSDEEVGEIKRAMVENPNSVFYKQLGDTKTATVFSKYLKKVQGSKFKEQSDYDEIEEILSELTVPRSKATTEPPKSPLKRSPRRTSPRKPAAERPGVGVKRTRTIATQTPAKIPRQNSSKMDIDADDSDDSFDDPMDTVDENSQPQDEDIKPKARAKREPVKRREKVVINVQINRHSKKHAETEVIYDSDNVEESDNEPEGKGVARMPARLQRRGVELRIIEGPHRGESFVIEDGGMETIVIGSKPTTKVGKTIALPKDDTLSATHVRFDLSLKKGINPGIMVTNKSKGKTFVNCSAITSTKAFVGNIITVGKTTLEVQSL